MPSRFMLSHLQRSETPTKKFDAVVSNETKVCIRDFVGGVTRFAIGWMSEYTELRCPAIPCDALRCLKSLAEHHM